MAFPGSSLKRLAPPTPRKESFPPSSFLQSSHSAFPSSITYTITQQSLSYLLRLETTHPVSVSDLNLARGSRRRRRRGAWTGCRGGKAPSQSEHSGLLVLTNRRPSLSDFGWEGKFRGVEGSLGRSSHKFGARGGREKERGRASILPRGEHSPPPPCSVRQGKVQFIGKPA